MSVPIHNLYDFIHQVTEKQYFLKYFDPPGEKNLINLVDYSNKEFASAVTSAQVPQSNPAHKIVPGDCTSINWTYWNDLLICHDQEPLDYEYYQDYEVLKDTIKLWEDCEHIKIQANNLLTSQSMYFRKNCILLHSEANSKELEKYESSGKYIGAHWWSHGMLSRDWYRFAQYDQDLRPRNMQKLFLLYCRDISGKRSYRKTFMNKLEFHCLLDYCQTNYKNKQNLSSNLSAVYNTKDFSNTGISVILETVFDQRIHLTEKTTRALACGHPFIIANGPGCLEYLKSYGFKTFHPYINEHYDKILNCDDRMQCIIEEMQRLSQLPANKQQKIIDECRQISDYNKKLFFSDQFFLTLKNELIENLEQAKSKAGMVFDVNGILRYLKAQRVVDNSNRKFKQKILLHFLKHIKKGGTLEDYVPPDLD